MNVNKNLSKFNKILLLFDIFCKGMVAERG